MTLARLASAQLLLLTLSLASGCLSHQRSEPDRDAGADAGPLHDTDVGYHLDTGALYDGGARSSSCVADDARAAACGPICDGLDHYGWDGERCSVIPCGTCEGTDCERLPTSLEACESSHATCVSQLCRATGGAWLFFAEECQHFACGVPQPAECLVGMPVCDCGPEHRFDPVAGCVAVTDCPEFDPLPSMELCNTTGGAWTDGICCSPRCGVPCDLPCAGPACVCGPTQVFDTLRGCIDTVECHVRAAGEVCDESRDVRCADGLLCCARCGGAGCDPESRCQPPVCDDDPDTDACGNNRFAP